MNRFPSSQSPILPQMKSHKPLLANTFALALLFLGFGLIPAHCQTGQGVVAWTTGTDSNGNSYEAFLTPGGITWPAAESNAEALGGHLASIHSLDEDNFVFSLVSGTAFWEAQITGKPREYGPWIGGVKLSDGDWSWSDGTPFNYTNWAANEPDNDQGVENNIQFFGHTIANTWNDENGDNDYPTPIAVSLPNGYVVEWVTPPVKPMPGSYTVLMTATDASPGIPQGTGYGILRLDKSGKEIFSGQLPDGERFHTMGKITNNSLVYQSIIYDTLFYRFLYTKGERGVFTGALLFQRLPGSDFHGTVEWAKPPQRRGRYPMVTDTAVGAIGSFYTPPAPGTSPLPGFGTGTLELSDTTGTVLSVPAQFSTASQLIFDTHPDHLTVRISLSTGVFKGTFIYPGHKDPTEFAGVLFQNQTIGQGFFLGPNGSGTVSLAPAP